MADITDYVLDTTLLEQIIKSLRDSFNIHVSVVDSNEDIVSVGDNGHKELEYMKFYPFESTEDIGGLRCSACDQNTFNNADNQIQIYLTMIKSLIEKETEAQQMCNEIIELSEQINFLYTLAGKISGTKKMITLCEMIIKEISEKIGADRSFFAVLDEQGKSTTATINISEEEVNELRKEKVFTNAIEKADTLISTTVNGMSVIISPVNTKDEIIGLMAYFRNKDKRFFVAHEKKFVSIVINTVKYSLETLRLYENLREVYLNTVKALTAAIDAKDPYTHGHSHRVAKYSVIIAKTMNLPVDEISMLEVAAYLHDLGKIGIPDAILKKTGKLSDEEFNEIKQHPTFTNKIIDPIKLPEYIVQVALQHHEKLGGGGYPNGLSGDKITIGARIVAVADVFDALTSDRPYRKAMTVEDALKVLVDEIGTHFDKEAVIALVQALGNDQESRCFEDVYPERSIVDFHRLNKFLTALYDQLIDSGAIPVEQYGK